MKFRTAIALCISAGVAGCGSPTDDAVDAVKGFLVEVQTKGADKFGGSLTQSREAIDYRFVTSEFEALVRNNFVAVPQKDTETLTAEKRGDDVVIVTSSGKAGTIFGTEVSQHLMFEVRREGEVWKVADAQGLVFHYLNFSIEDTQWVSYWDLKKAKILEEVERSVAVTPISAGERSKYSSMVSGAIRIDNKSSLDLSKIEVMIEHFDKDGVSVNIDSDTVYDVIRSNSYRETEWTTTDCDKCVSQKFSIKFLEKTIK